MSGSELDRVIPDAIARLQKPSNEHSIHDALDLLERFLNERGRLAETTPLKVFDDLIDALLSASVPSSPGSVKAMSLLTAYLSRDERMCSRFKPSKSMLAKLNLALCIQGSDRVKAEAAMELALFMLRTYETLDLSLITADPKLVSKILWADRQRMWSQVQQRDVELPDLKYQLSCMKATMDSQFAAMQEMRLQHQQQQGSLATQNSTIVDVEGDMRQVLNAVKQLELAVKSQAASLKALEIASKSQSGAIQQLQQSIRDEKAFTRAMNERVDQLENNTIAGLLDGQNNATANRAAIDETQQQLASMSNEMLSISALIKTQAEGMENLEAAMRSNRDQLIQLQGTMHPLFAAVEQLESASKTSDTQRVRATGDLEQNVAHCKKEIQGILLLLKQFDTRLTDQRDKLSLTNTHFTEQSDALQKVMGQVRATSSQLDGLASTHDSAIAYLKETVKQQGYSIQRLKLGNTGSAPATPMSPQLDSNVQQAASMMNMAALEAKVKQHEAAIEELERITKQQQASLSEMHTTVQNDTAALQKLQSQTEYDVRQLRTTAETQDFGLHDVQETTKQLAADLQHLQAAHKHDETELHRLMAASKYQQLSLQQLEGTMRNHSTDLHHLQDLTQNTEQKLAAAVQDHKAHETTMQKFRVDTETALQHASKTLDSHTSNIYELQDYMKTSGIAVHALEMSVGAHDSLIHGQLAASESTIQQLRTSVETLEQDMRQAVAMGNTHTSQLQHLESQFASLEVTVQELRTLSKQNASNEHQLNIRLTTLDQTVQKMKEASRQFTTQASQAKSLMEGQEQSVQKIRESFDQTLGTLRATVKTLENENIQLRTMSKTQEGTLAKMSEMLRTQEMDIQRLTLTTRAHDQTLLKLGSDQDDGFTGSLQPSRASDSQMQLRQTVESIRSSLLQYKEVLAAHDQGLKDLKLDSEQSLMSFTKQIEAMSQQWQNELRRLQDEKSYSAPHRMSSSTDEQAAIQKLQQSSADHDKVLQDIQASVADLASGLGLLRNASTTQASDISRLKEITQHAAQGIAQVAESGRDTREFINQEARGKCRDLLRPTISVTDKLIIMDWIVRNLKFLDTSTIYEAISNFRDYASANRDAFGKSMGARLPEVVQAVLGLINTNGTNTHFVGQLLDILDCVIISDANLESALSFGMVSLLLKLAVHPNDSLKTKALTVLQTSSRADVCLTQILENGGVEPLVSLMRWDDPAVVLQACSVTRQCLRSDDACRAFAALNAFPVLVELLNHPDGVVREHTAGALRNGSRKDDLAQLVVDAGGLDALVRAARDPHTGTSKNAIAALRNIARNPKYQKQIHLLGGLELLGLRYPVVK